MFFLREGYEDAVDLSAFTLLEELVCEAPFNQPLKGMGELTQLKKIWIPENYSHTASLLVQLGTSVEELTLPDSFPTRSDCNSDTLDALSALGSQNPRFSNLSEETHKTCNSYSNTSSTRLLLESL